MDLVSLAFAAALTTPAAPPTAPGVDLDTPLNELRSTLNSPFLRDMTIVAMSLPYKYGVTQMPCKAREWQPTRGWVAAREPSGKIAWSVGAETSVRWAGIYGTCQIVAPVAREDLPRFEREALECECNGWLPKGVSSYPQP